MRAQAIANEAANQLIRLTPAGTENVDQSRQAFIAQQLDELEASIVATREEISKKQSELASMLSARQIADAQTQIAALEAKLRTLAGELRGVDAEHAASRHQYDHHHRTGDLAD